MLFILNEEKLSALFPRTPSQNVKDRKMDSNVAENSLCCQALRVVICRPKSSWRLVPSMEPPGVNTGASTAFH